MIVRMYDFAQVYFEPSYLLILFKDMSMNMMIYLKQYQSFQFLVIFIVFKILNAVMECS